MHEHRLLHQLAVMDIASNVLLAKTNCSIPASRVSTYCIQADQAAVEIKQECDMRQPLLNKAAMVIVAISAMHIAMQAPLHCIIQQSGTFIQ